MTAMSLQHKHSLLVHSWFTQWLAVQRAFFPGDSELQQLLYIFKILGTPTEDTWPGVTDLKDWHEFPNWQPQDLQKVFPTLHPDGVDLMRQMFIYDPAKRISVSLTRCPAAWLPALPRMACRSTIQHFARCMPSSPCNGCGTKCHLRS